MSVFFDAWPRTALTPNGDSWVALQRRVLPVSPEEFEHLWSLAPPEKAAGIVYGKKVTFPRRTAAFGRDYTFSGQTTVALDADQAPGYAHYATWMTNANLNGVLINWYDAADGDYIGSHSDNEAQLCTDAPIVSITWTSTDNHFRRFRLKPKNSAGLFPTFGEGPGIVSLRHGDALVMGGLCQKTHKHEIMPVRKRISAESHGRRINVTLRRFA